ncbi:MAG TPA: hypothetical protein VI670_24410 [Thermoanaerobaculia bacterium]|jgi:hypothetical protein
MPALAVIAVLFAEVFVRTQPGVVVVLDGVPQGVTNTGEGGLHICPVEPGLHQLTLQVPDGGAATLPVEVKKFEGAVVDISSLQLHAQTTRRGGIEVRTSRRACTAITGEHEVDVVDGAALFDSVAPGTMRVTLRCGSESLARDVEVGVGRIAIVEADWNARTLRAAGDRAKAMPVAVAEPGDLFVDLPLPAAIKRGLINAIPPGVKVMAIKADGARVTARFECIGDTAGDLLERLRMIHRLRDMTILDAEYVGDHVIVDVELWFAVTQYA